MGTPAPSAHWAYTLHVPHDARAIGVARSTLHAVLVRDGLAHLLDSALLLATELLTNAYLHSGGPAAFRLRRAAGTLRLGVQDTDPHPPEVRCPGPDEEGGRGLLLVLRHADTWGWFPLGDGLGRAHGKVTWCELRHGAPDRDRWGTAA